MYSSLYIAWRYFFSHSNAKVVNLISLIASLALSISTIALIVILSIFEGLKSLHVNLYENINPDIKIAPLKGKELNLSDELIDKITQIKEIKSISKTLEEKIYLSYKQKNHLCYIKGVDKAYNEVIGFDKSIMLGESFFSKPNTIVVGLEIAQFLSIFLEDQTSPISILIPKPGKGLITKESIEEKETMASGIFHLFEEINQSYVYSSLEFTQDLLKKKGIFYNLEIKAKKQKDIHIIKNKLSFLLNHKEVSIKTRAEQQEALFKMIHTENLIVYLLLSLISIITAFNLVGALIILKLDKKHQIYLIWALGTRKNQIKDIFFFLGGFITLISWIIGLIIGYGIVFIQKKYHWIKLDKNTIFPIEITFSNFLISSLTILVIGFSTAYFSSRKLPSLKALSLAE